MLDEYVTILLIEDEPAHAELVRRAFEDRGDRNHIDWVSTLTAARAYLESATPHLIIADWRLPDGESLDLLADTDQRTVPILIMTSYGDEQVAVRAMKAGALDYMVKSQEILQDMPHIAERAIHQWWILSEKEHIQNQLRASEAQFRLLAENSSDLITRLDLEGKCLYASPACRALLGYTPEEMVGHQVVEIIHPDDLPEATRCYARILQQPVTDMVTYRLRHQNGQYLWFESTLHAIFDDGQQRPMEIQISTRDITRRKNAEETLRNAHHALEQAYEDTIKGWSRALDLRDRETEGHTQRVAEMTLRLARAVGIPEADLPAIYRGVLLHDIGKLGVRDEILQKKGALDEVEWDEMRRHVNYAYDMLYPIEHLRQSLDIPYLHHEKWDGTGYPLGLKGEQIPLPVRIFTVVDVWDAMSSDRPYHKSWAQPAVVAYLRAQSGKHFDPQVVEAFLTIISEG